jgi:hypothetical protein
VFGIGLRVAGRVAGERLSSAAQSAPGPAAGSAEAGQPAANTAARSRTRATTSGSLGRGVRGFLRPFGRIGRTLWLEVTGVFFFLPVLVFGPTVWRTRASFAHGPDHRAFVASVIVVVVFFYLSATSFWRARRRE